MNETRSRSAIEQAIDQALGRTEADLVIKNVRLLEFKCPEIVEELQQFTHVIVHLDHAVGILVPSAGDAVVMVVQVGAIVHPSRVVPDEEGLLCVGRIGDEAFAFFHHFVVEIALPLLSERPEVLDCLAAVGCGDRVNDTALRESGVLESLGRIIALLRIFAGI